MMKRAAVVLIALALCVIPHLALAQWHAGVALWKAQATLEVDRAIDFDGSNETFDESLKDWDTEGSGVGLSLAYQFPQIVRVFGEVGLGQSTVRVEDVMDPNRDVNTIAFNDAVYAAVGVRPEGFFPNSERVFWSGGLMFSFMSSDFDEDITTSWEYQETLLSIDGRVGYQFDRIGVYGGLQLANYNGELQETDIANPAGLQVREWELDREQQVDLLLGARANSKMMTGSVELGFVGAMSAKATLSLAF
jgi:hypothetical protein